jgi:hypothetical protein
LQTQKQVLCRVLLLFFLLCLYVYKH